MLEFEGHPISVAIRIPPALNQSKKVSNSLIQVEDATTISITNPEDPTEIRVFGFTHCYWSFDGYAELQDGHILPDLKHPNGNKYADQRKVFDHFGKEMVQNAWLGFNSSLICMGESYSGKSWTLFGQGVNKGMISQFGTELFKTTKDKEKTSGTSPVGNLIVEGKLTMMEIQDNKVRDLLMGGNTKYKTVVKVREHPKRGFYVEGLRSVIVSNGDDLQQRLDEGAIARASSPTSLNLISGSNTKTTVIVSLSLVQKYRNAKGDEVVMSAIIDFYDLPGSGGNVNSSPHNGHTTQKLKSNNPTSRMKMMTGNRKSPTIEGPSPKTLKTFEDHFTGLVSALGNSTNFSYTNSTTVTKLLERTLSGNCKTFVIFHCTPTEKGYDEALSSLILADKLQRLRTYPVMNEEMTNKLTRELRLENDNLKKMLTSGEYEKNEFFASSDKLDGLRSQDSDEFKRQIVDDIKSQVKDNEREIKILNQTFEEKIKLAKLDRPNDNSQTIKKLETEKKHKAFILNLNSDSQLTGRLLHLIPPGQTDLGSTKVKADGTIPVIGPGIRELHGTFFVHSGKENKITLKPAGPDCLVKVNGILVQFEVSLFHNDRILFGGSSFWLFQNPREPWADSKTSLSSRITFQFAQEELASRSQFFMQLSTENDPPSTSTRLKSEVVRIFPLVQDANAICDDLERGVFFDPIVLHDINKLLLRSSSGDEFEGRDKDFTGDRDPREVGVQLNFIKESMSFVLSPEEFAEKYKALKNSYVQSQEDGIGKGGGGSVNNSPNLDMQAATLSDMINTEVTIGYGLMSLKPLAYLIQHKEDVVILDFISLKPIGTIQIEVLPCNNYFEALRDAQSFLTKPSELLTKPLHFTLKIGSGESLSANFKDITCHYKIHTEPITSTGKLDSKPGLLPSSIINSQWKYERRFSIEHVTPKLIESLERDLVIFTFYGRQRLKKMRNQFKSEYNQNYYPTSHQHPPHPPLSNNPEYLTNSPYLGLIQKQRAELIVSKKAGARVEQKLEILQTMLQLSDTLSQDTIAVDYLKKICSAKDQETASESLAAFEEEFTPPPDVEPTKKLTTYQKVSEVCGIV